MFAWMWAVVTENPQEILALGAAGVFWLRMEQRLTRLEEVVSGRLKPRRESNSCNGIP